MASCHRVCMVNTSSSEAGVPCGSHHRLFRWCINSRAVPLDGKNPLHSCPSFYLARALKNNHPGHGPLLPIISLIYAHLSLHFPFLLSIVLPSRLPLIVFVFLCPFFCSGRVLLFASSLLYFPPCSHSPCMSLLLILSSTLLCFYARSSSSKCQKCTEPFSQASTQSSLSSSFILSANNLFNSTLLISVFTPLPTHTNSHTLP